MLIAATATASSVWYCVGCLTFGLGGVMPEKISVVIPCYRVASQILGVLKGIGPEVDSIYVVDDACPEGTASLVRNNCEDRRVVVLSHEANLGVGGATISGYRRAIADGAEIVVKLDGDGQMDPANIGKLSRPIRDGLADYTKGCSAPGSLDTSLSHAAGLIEIAACHA